MSYSKLDPTSGGPSPHLTSGSLDCSRSPASVCTDESSLHFLCRWVDEICLARNPKWFTIRTSEPFPLNLSSNQEGCRKNTSIDRVIFQFEGSLALIPLNFTMVFLGFLVFQHPEKKFQDPKIASLVKATLSQLDTISMALSWFIEGNPSWNTKRKKNTEK